MAKYLLLFSIIILVSVLLKKISGKLGVPVLLLFLALGIVFGSSDSTFAARYAWLVNEIGSIALIFIMFYGGFGTRWSSARPIVVEAGLLATVGVALTAGFVGLFCHYALGWPLVESFLMGAVISSTDAATVFSVLRQKRLGLKNNTAPLLEVESGSNDPMSYMLTAVMLSVIKGNASGGMVVWTIFTQLFFGAACGLLLATGAVFLARRNRIKDSGFESLFILAIAILAYALPSLINGNGYLSTYIVGIVLGNTFWKGSKTLTNFFDGVTSLMQVLIFFLLGMLADPPLLVKALLPALIIFVFLTLVARPLAVGGILAPFGKFKKYPINQIGLVSFVGLRGAASIVFAIMILTEGSSLHNDIFSIVFCIVLVSIALQGSLIPFVARKTKMTDDQEDVMTTFSDFSENSEMSFGCIHIHSGGNWCGKAVKDLNLPSDFLITLVVRDRKKIVVNGNTVLLEGDDVITCSRSFEGSEGQTLIEHPLLKGSRYVGAKVKDYPRSDKSLLVMIRRGEERIIPKGDTVIQEGDVFVLLERE